jgi:hypothetical protein
MISSKINKVSDNRGSLISIDKLPKFSIRRIYIIDCIHGMTRGDHFHKNGEQMICLLEGKLFVEDVMKDEIISFTMEPGDSYIQRVNHKFRFRSLEKTSKLIVLSDTEHDESDYYNTWREDESTMDD